VGKEPLMEHLPTEWTEFEWDWNWDLFIRNKIIPDFTDIIEPIINIINTFKE
jgi:hypothetical protein